MKDAEFTKIFEDAQNGDLKALEILISMFMPSIYKNSFINGKLDYDCVQELILRFIISIQKFNFCIKDNIFTFFDIDNR